MTKRYYKKRAGFTPKQMVDLGENFVLGFKKGTEKTIDVLPYSYIDDTDYFIYYNGYKQYINSTFREARKNALKLLNRGEIQKEIIDDILSGVQEKLLYDVGLFKFKVTEAGGWCEKKDYIETAEAKIGKYSLRITDVLCNFANLEFIIRGMLQGEKGSC